MINWRQRLLSSVCPFQRDGQKPIRLKGEKYGKKYKVVQRHYAGMIGVEFVVSSHSTTKAAWRAYHKYVNEAKKNRIYDVRYFVLDENDKYLLEVKRRNANGRWETL